MLLSAGIGGRAIKADFLATITLDALSLALIMLLMQRMCWTSLFILFPDDLTSAEELRAADLALLLDGIDPTKVMRMGL